MITRRHGIVVSVLAGTFALLAACSDGGGVIGAGTVDAGQESAAVDRAPPPPTEAGPPVEAGPLPGTIEATWVGICTTKLALKDPAQALRFFVETSFVPYDAPADAGADAGGDAGDASDDADAGTDSGIPANPLYGSLAMKMTPLQGWNASNADTFTPPTISATYFRASVIPLKSTVVAADGRFAMQLGTWNMSAEANSISGRDAVIEQLSLDGLHGTTPNRFCARLGGHLVVPYDYIFEPEDNVCLFVEAKLDDPMPALGAEEFICAF